MIKIRSQKYVVLTTIIFFNALLYPMDEKQNRRCDDKKEISLLNILHATLKVLNEPKTNRDNKIAGPSFSRLWLTCYPNESPYSALNIDTHAPEEELKKALSEIDCNNEQNSKILVAKKILSSNNEGAAFYNEVTSQLNKCYNIRFASSLSFSPLLLAFYADLALYLKALLYPMGEQPISIDYDNNNKKREAISFSQLWLTCYPDESPYSVLHVDPYASQDKLKKALSGIDCNKEQNPKIVIAKKIFLSNNELAKLRCAAELKFGQFISKFCAAQSSKKQVKLCQRVFKMEHLYPINPIFYISFFADANSVFKKGAQKGMTLNELTTLPKIIEKQKALYATFKTCKKFNNDSHIIESIALLEQDLNTISDTIHKISSQIEDATSRSVNKLDMLEFQKKLQQESRKSKLF